MRANFSAEYFAFFTIFAQNPVACAELPHSCLPLDSSAFQPITPRFPSMQKRSPPHRQGYVAHFNDTPREAWLHEAELKLFGVINPVQAFQAQLEQSDIASITCVNSLLALQPEEHMIATSAARAALLNMTLTLSKELVSKGIRVNSILLGMVESGQWQRRFENRADKSQSWPQWTADIARKRGIPMARLGKPQEPAQALLFLASPLASFTTGAALDVSGGFCRHL